jgi:hypothetical protein
MKGCDLRYGGFFREKSSRQEVDRIPQSAATENSIEHCQNGHGYAACQSALDACRNRINLKRQPRSVQFVCYPFDAGYLRAGGSRNRYSFN